MLLVPDETRPPDEPIVAEIIGRTTSPYTRAMSTRRYMTSVDRTQTNYEFWSKLRRGKEAGYEIGGLFNKRIAEIDAEWSIGRGFTVETENDGIDEQATEFIEESIDTLMTWRKDSNALGDAYLIVNMDGSLSMPSPDTVEVITDKLDYTTVIGYTITTLIEDATITDTYTLQGRTITIERGGQKSAQSFPNLIGMLPVIPLHNDRESNEIYGHPMGETLLRLYARYDDGINKTGDGVEVMGRPIPVAEGLKDPAQAKRLNSTRTEPVHNSDGTTSDVDVVDFEDLTMLWLGEGATFKFASPGTFSTDSMNYLKKLFFLMLEHSGIPEWAWGGAVASSKASVEAQMPAFTRYVEARQVYLRKSLKQLFTVWLAVQRVIAFVAAVEKITVTFAALEGKNEELELNKANSAKDRNAITDETYVRLLDIVEDPAAEVKAAQAEAEQAQQDAFDREVDMQIKTGNNQDDEDGDNKQPFGNKAA